jgi:cytochrome c peroxidase
MRRARIFGFGIAAVCGAMAVWAQPPLKQVPIPQPPNLAKYVRSNEALVALGKALFWDMQTGSDGRVACASCHFHAGADHRAQNQLSNPLGAFVANYTLTPGDFPFHVLSNGNDNRSSVLRDSTQRAGSSGEFRRLYVDTAPGATADMGVDASDLPAFAIDGVNVRQVTKRNTPTVINSVYNFRNFWDGRANNIFTGRTPFGDSDTRANALVVSSGSLATEKVRVENSSLASQAVGPPVSNVEMAYDGRSWPELGKRMLPLRPLASQTVAPDDSVLGTMANPGGRGLRPEITYGTLVQSAFQPEYWSAADLVDAGGALLGRNGSPASSTEFAQAEFNFSLFFGLAVQAYEATLISDDTPFDRFAGGTAGALTAQEQSGQQIFQGRGGCARCHSGAEFTAASFGNVTARGQVQRGGAGPDQGFFRTGVRRTEEDIASGDRDDFGNPFSATVAQNPNAIVDGTFKTPGLRNIEFSGPYFHNGGAATLEQAIDFYSRGGDFPDGPNVGRGLRVLNLSADDRAALVAFLKALTDDRVRFERAPFDHPELCVSAGHMEAVDPASSFSAEDKWVGIPAVGRNGNAVPLQTFDELLRGVGSDGSRAHTLTDACTVQ